MPAHGAWQVGDFVVVTVVLGDAAHPLFVDLREIVRLLINQFFQFTVVEEHAHARWATLNRDGGR